MDKPELTPISQSIYCLTIYLIFVRITVEIGAALSGETSVKVYKMVKEEAERMISESEAGQ